jgi:hypothetical protein
MGWPVAVSPRPEWSWGSRLPITPSASAPRGGATAWKRPYTAVSLRCSHGPTYPHHPDVHPVRQEMRREAMSERTGRALRHLHRGPQLVAERVHLFGTKKGAQAVAPKSPLVSVAEFVHQPLIEHVAHQDLREFQSFRCPDTDSGATLGERRLTRGRSGSTRGLAASPAP